MRLLTEIEPQRRASDDALPDHIEMGVRIAGMKIWDASRYQAAAALNSAAVRFHFPDLPATRMMACEQYAYARWLMGIDDYWLTLEQRFIPMRMDYKVEQLLG